MNREQLEQAAAILIARAMRTGKKITMNQWEVIRPVVSNKLYWHLVELKLIAKDIK